MEGWTDIVFSVSEKQYGSNKYLDIWIMFIKNCVVGFIFTVKGTKL